MLNKRRQIRHQRKVPIEYMERMIVESEEALAESRKRLIEQELAAGRR
jgi:hypothetical protein